MTSQRTVFHIVTHAVCDTCVSDFSAVLMLRSPINSTMQWYNRHRQHVGQVFTIFAKYNDYGWGMKSNLNSKGIINQKDSGLSILLCDMTTFLNSNALCVFHTSFTFRVTSCYKYFRLDLYWPQKKSSDMMYSIWWILIPSMERSSTFYFWRYRVNKDFSL